MPSSDCELADIQSRPPSVPLTIDRVGLRGFSLPLRVRQRDTAAPQRTVAVVSLGVALAADHKGTHMSRFVELLQDLSDKADSLDQTTVTALMRETCDRLRARSAQVEFRFPYFLRRPAPASDLPALVPYQCGLAGELHRDDPARWSGLTLTVKVPVMTVCPCSRAISREGAHSQRAEVRVSIRLKRRVWIEDMVELAETSGSSPLYSLLKRPDEKFVTEHAFARPLFVEDVARHVAAALMVNADIASFRVEVESQESIHPHNAFARIDFPG